MEVLKEIMYDLIIIGAGLQGLQLGYTLKRELESGGY